MTTDPERGAGSRPMVARTVSVDWAAHGGWAIELPEPTEPIVCDTLKEAQRVAYLCAAQRSPCELIVHDAYHRLLHHELLAVHRRVAAPARPRTAFCP